VRLLLLVNVAASSVTPRIKVQVQEALSASHSVTVVETSRRGHASRLAKGAVADGYDVVVVLGGDGTLNEAANGLAGSATALAVLPGGSTNVFARTIGFTNHPVKAAGELVVALREPARTIRRIGLGQANGRYFVFHAGLGFDAAVVEQVERRGSLKRVAGHPLFLYAAVDTWMRHYDRHRPHFDIRVTSGSGPPSGPAPVIRDVYFAICLKTNPYTFLGEFPIKVAPDAGLERAFTIVAFQTLSLPVVMGVLGAAMAGRGGARLAKDGKVAYLSDVTALSISGHGAFPFQLDGDFLGEIDQLDLCYQPDLLNLVVPPA
jgi:diacylglycerol kinase family enzyme